MQLEWWHGRKCGEEGDGTSDGCQRRGEEWIVVGGGGGGGVVVGGGGVVVVGGGVSGGGGGAGGGGKRGEFEFASRGGRSSVAKNIFRDKKDTDKVKIFQSV